MLRVSDSIILAKTKFRTRRIRLILSLLVISLVCGVISAAVLAVYRSSKSLAEVSKYGLHGRFLAHVNGGHSSENYDYMNPPSELIAEAELIYKDEIARRKSIAKKLNYEYIQSESDNPIEKDDEGNKSLRIYSSEIAAQVWYKHLQSKKMLPSDNAKKMLAEVTTYSPSKIYKPPFNGVYGLNYIYKGVGFRGDKEAQSNNEKELRYTFSTAVNVAHVDLAKPFRFRDYTLNENEIPIFVNYKVASQILELTPLKKDATDKQRYERIVEIRNKIRNEKIQLCFRNEVANSELSNYQLAKKNKNASRFEYAELGPCENVKIIKDKRNAEEKLEDQKEAKFLEAIGKSPEPAEVKTLNFRVVGISDYGYESSIFTDWQSFLHIITNSSLGYGDVIIDGGLLAENVKDDNILKLFKEKQNQSYINKVMSVVLDSLVVEFSDIGGLRKIINEKGCSFDGCNISSGIFASPYGNQIIMIDQSVKYFESILTYVLVGVVVLVSIMIFVVVNRIMSDSRKETAVFRAIGYSQFDILQIYISYIAIYSLIVTILTSLVVVLLEIISRTIFEPKVGEFFTHFLALESTVKFEIMRFSPVVFLIFVVIFLIGFFASSLPLIINTRRSPLKNLRSE